MHIAVKGRHTQLAGTGSPVSVVVWLPSCGGQLGGNSVLCVQPSAMMAIDGSVIGGKGSGGGGGGDGADGGARATTQQVVVM